MDKQIRVVLAEDHALVRAGIRTLVEDLGYADVVAEASNGQEAVQYIELHKPDLVFMDIAMPMLNGLQVTDQMIRKYPDLKIIILSMHASEEYVLQALQAGAAGYMMKDADMSELSKAVEVVLSGKNFLSPSVSQHVASYIRRIDTMSQKGDRLPNKSANQPMIEINNLTSRQVQILTLISEGFSTKQIAMELNISIKTAEAHRSNIMNRLEIFDIAALVRYALRKGLIEA